MIPFNVSLNFRFLRKKTFKNKSETRKKNKSKQEARVKIVQNVKTPRIHVTLLLLFKKKYSFLLSLVVRPSESYSSATAQSSIDNACRNHKSCDRLLRTADASMRSRSINITAPFHSHLVELSTAQMKVLLNILSFRLQIKQFFDQSGGDFGQCNGECSQLHCNQQPTYGQYSTWKNHSHKQRNLKYDRIRPDG